MKAISRFLLGGAVAGAIVFVGRDRAAADPVAPAALVARLAASQADAEQTRRMADQFLDRARAAMDAEDWRQAESLVAEAEKLNPHYGRFHLGDTPAKARQALQRRRPAAPPSGAPQQQQPASPAPAQPPAAAPPSGGDPGFDAFNMNRGAQRDPFDLGGPAPSDAQLPASASTGGRPLPDLSAAASASTPPWAGSAGVPSASSPLSATPTAGDRATAERMLLDARRALASGDSQRAQQIVDQVKGFNLSFDVFGDNPDKVAGLITRRAQAFADPSLASSEGGRRRQAEVLLEQAEGLLQGQDLDEAERLAHDARRLGVNFGPFDANPDGLLETIAQTRRNGGASAAPASTPFTAQAQPTAAGLTSSAPTPAGDPRKTMVLQMLAQARDALANNDLARAERIAQRAQAIGVPDNLFEPHEDRPGLVLLDLAKQQAGPVTQAAATAPTGGPLEGPATQAMYDATNDPTRNVQATSRQLLAGTQTTVPGAESGFLPPPGTTLVAEPVQPTAGQTPPGGLIDEAIADEEVMFRRVVAEITARERESDSIHDSDPVRALLILRESRVGVANAQIAAQNRDLLLRRLDRKIVELESYIQKNKARIELTERNRATIEEIERSREVDLEVQDELGKLVDEFNTLMDEQRYAEAEVVAARAMELAPNETIVLQLKQQSKVMRRVMTNQEINDAKERGYWNAMANVDRASTPYDDLDPLQFGNAKDWLDITKRRREWQNSAENRRSEQEREIEKTLKDPVTLEFTDTSLERVKDYLMTVTNINIILDPRGLAEEGVTNETPVSINIRTPISLKSALNLILSPLRLSYVIEDDVLKITSEQHRQGAVYTKNYDVGDLVIPIPNFTPSNRIGFTGALDDAITTLNRGYMGGFGGQAPLGVLASATGGASNGIVDPRILAQAGLNPGTGGGFGGPQSGPGQPMAGFGPGGMGGGALADFETLIELIVTTIQPTSWDEQGGPGAIHEFPTTLSLVISQTQEVHEEIAELLEQLRRLQDLQVTVEVRFITLQENFFERIGVDFDFNLNDNVLSVPTDPPGQIPNMNNIADLRHRNQNDVTVGLQAPGVFQSNLDIPFRQGSFTLAQPPFGGFDPASAGSIGFAILSDLEAFFFLEAAQGDQRSNVLQAPKVTLFNGQLATVADQSQSPFVVSVIPVVGDFAAAQQPVIVILSEGTFLTVQAVVSTDRRFVRLTVVPFFSSIGDVDTFTFTGSTTTLSDSSSTGPIDATTGRTNISETVTEGTTVQLPTFSFVNVATTVSVPDGGTVLLGGIKRLSEGRNEFGIPVLNKIPYLNRLFSNVGIGRETSSLMMMVTPRIIIQEEEEFNLTGVQP